MKYIASILVIVFVIFGVLLSLIALYASPDNQTHVLEASIFFLGSSIALMGLFVYLGLFKKEPN